MMSQQDTSQIPDQPKGRLSRYIIIFAVITFVFYLISGIIYSLESFNIIHGTWMMPLFTVFAGLGTTAGIPAAVLTFLQFLHSLVSRGLPADIHFREPHNYRNIHGNPPLTNPQTIHQRGKDVKEIYHQLVQKDTTTLALVGLAYIGKSTLAALVVDHAEKLRCQKIRQFFRRILRRNPFLAPPVWLRIDSLTTMADIARTLYEIFDEPIPGNFDGFGPHNQVRRIHSLLNKTKKARLVIIDQLDHLLDPHSGFVLPDHLALGEWLDTLNNKTCKCRFIITSRIWPRGSRNEYPTHMKKYLVNTLETKEGVELLQMRNVQGSKKELRAVVEYCDGHVHALDLLTQLDWHNRIPNLTALLKDPLYANIWQREIEQLFDPIFKEQLKKEHRELLLAFSVFREEVPLDVALRIRDFTSQMSQAHALSILHVLVGQHLIQEKERHCYQLPTILATYLQKHFSESDEQSNQKALQEAHERAAEYYEGFPVPAGRRSIEDLHFLLEEIVHRCLASQCPRAYKTMQDQNIFSDLKSRRNNETLQEIYQLLLPLNTWKPDPLQEAAIYKELGSIHHDLDQKEDALNFYDQAMGKYRDIYYWAEEGELLINLGDICRELEQNERASDYYEMALKLYQRQGFLRDQGHIYEKLGEVYVTLGKNEQAENSYAQVLDAFGLRAITCETLNNMGKLHLEKENNRSALACFRFAEQSNNCDNITNNIKMLRKKLGKEKYNELVVSVEGQELQIIKQGFV